MDYWTQSRTRLHRDATLTLRVISGRDDAWLVVGYAIPAKFQTIGLSDSSNLKLEMSVERTTSADHRGQARHTFWRNTGTYSFPAVRT